MTAKADVTTTQVAQLRKIANDKGISRGRFQQWLDKEAVGIIDQLKSILTLIASVALDPIERFIAADNFKIDTSTSAKVKIGWMSDDFKRSFLGKVEENVSAATLNLHRVEKDSLDKDIRAELGTECEKITLGQFYQMLAKQPRGESGPLLTDGCANIAYIEDTNDNLWAVHASWSSNYDHWRVHARSVTHPRRWYGGDQVVSRK